MKNNNFKRIPFEGNQTFWYVACSIPGCVGLISKKFSKGTFFFGDMRWVSYLCWLYALLLYPSCGLKNAGFKWKLGEGCPGHWGIWGGKRQGGESCDIPGAIGGKSGGGWKGKGGTGDEGKLFASGWGGWGRWGGNGGGGGSGAGQGLDSCDENGAGKFSARLGSLGLELRRRGIPVDNTLLVKTGIHILI